MSDFEALYQETLWLVHDDIPSDNIARRRFLNSLWMLDVTEDFYELQDLHDEVELTIREMEAA